MSDQNKRQLIEDIRRFNATAQPRFLAKFDEEALRQYLDHLQSAREKTIRTTVSPRRKPQPKLRMVG